MTARSRQQQIKTMAKTKISYEKSLAEIQQILARIANQEIGIDDLEKEVKKARELLEACREKLRSTEKEINGLMK
jgi:exodeoxyribonuclease VII small subunit